MELPGLLDPTEGDVGRPMYFISHAWNNPIELLFRQVFDFLASADDSTRVWLDVLAVCQHESKPAHRADIAAFPDVVKACSGGTLVVMDLTRWVGRIREGTNTRDIREGETRQGAHTF